MASNHLMVVCVVCLLCADPLPCQLHTDKEYATAGFSYNDEYTLMRNNTSLLNRTDQGNFVDYGNNKSTSSESESESPSATPPQLTVLKTISDRSQREHKVATKKRHASYDYYNIKDLRKHGPLLTKVYLDKIFTEYGQNANKSTLNAAEFQSFLKSLGLYQFLSHNQQTANATEDVTMDNQTCYTDHDLVCHVKALSGSQRGHRHHHHHHHHHHIIDNENVSEHQQEEAHDDDDREGKSNAEAMFAYNCEEHHPHQEQHHYAHNNNNNNNSDSIHIISNTKNHQSKHNYKVNMKDFLNLCPILLYHVQENLMHMNENASNSGSNSSDRSPITVRTSPSSSSSSPSCITKDIIKQLTVSNEYSPSIEINETDTFYVWMYAFLAVFACSILGLVGIAILPLMESRFYKSIIQFLVSLAVGTMTGDALLHLLPHSLAGHNEKNMVLKGLACLGGIMFFYITEHGLTMISEWRNKKKKETTKQSSARVMRDPDSSLNNSVTGEKVCKSKYSSYPYCYDEIAMDTMDDIWLHLPKKSSENNLAHNTTTITDISTMPNNKIENDSTENPTQSLLSTTQNSNNSYSAVYETDKQCFGNNQQQQCRNNRKNIRPHQQQQQSMQQQSVNGTSQQKVQRLSVSNESNSANAIASLNSAAIIQSTDFDCNIDDGSHQNHNPSSLSANNNANGGKADLSLMDNNTVTVIIREHESSHHGHSHKHGHVHSPPGTFSAVVWMIIMGDGLHNFTDGMAIGAAFSENITGGFSTALAVFCHELPHELGDFAILLKAGMSVKTAVYYNLLTGVLSFIGMVFGIIFGQSHETAQWMFAVAAGLFIYIAMVDMMPEITAAHKSLQEFAMQILGMTTGVVTMLLIAIYEDDLINLFSISATNIGHHHSISSSSISHHNH